MDLGLKDRVYVVTGGTRGLGLAAARELTADGARVVVSGLKVTPSRDRSIWKPSSLPALSVQLRSICALDAAAALRPPGAAGVAVVVALAVFE